MGRKHNLSILLALGCSLPECLAGVAPSVMTFCDYAYSLQVGKYWDAVNGHKNLSPFLRKTHLDSVYQRRLRSKLRNVFQPSDEGSGKLSDDEYKNLVEYFLGGGSSVYARTFDQCMSYYRAMGLEPEKMKGKVLVDIGSGLSNFVDEMSVRYGAEGRGVDIIFHGDYGKNATTKNVSSYQGPDKPVLKTKELHDHAFYMAEAKTRRLDLDRRFGGSATNLPFSDESVDVTTALMSTMYLPEGPQLIALNEILRILKPGGKAYFVHDDAPNSEASGLQNENTQLILKRLKELGVPAKANPYGLVLEKIRRKAARIKAPKFERAPAL